MPKPNTDIELEAKVSASLARGFSFAWPVHEKYAIENNVLVGKGEVSRLIAPAGEVELFAALAKVPQGKIKPTEFASEFGLLGYSHVCEAEKRCGGDPIPWFRDNAKTILRLLILLELIEQRKSEEIRQWLAGLRSYHFPAAARDPIRAGKEAVSTILNDNLIGIHRHLRVTTDGKIRSVFLPRALIDVVYWQLADYAGGRGTVRHCLGCGDLFIAEDPRRLHCPGKTCANRRWVRLFRERKKKKGRRRR